MKAVWERSTPDRVNTKDKSFEAGRYWGTEVEYAQGRVDLMRETGMQIVPDFIGLGMALGFTEKEL